MTRPFLAMSCALLGLAVACGDDGSGDASSGSTGTEPTSSSSGDAPGTTDGNATDTPDTTTGLDSSSGSEGSSGDETEGDTDTAGVDCSNIPPGPLAAEQVFAPGNPFDGSEDIAFDGQGNVAGKAGGSVVLVDASGTEVDSWPDPGPAWGLRYRGNGDLVAAKYQDGEIIVVNDGGALLVPGLSFVNGLHPDFDGNLWFTDGDTVQRLNPDGSVDALVTGFDASGSNGLVWDPDRGLLFFNAYGSAQVRAVEIMGDGSPGAVSTLTSVGGPGSALDGLTMDACGNLYAVDQAQSALYRVYLDEAGAVIGDPELLIASFPSNVANAVFGSGDGWDPNSIYAAGVPGGVYRVEIGVPGAPYPTP